MKLLVITPDNGGRPDFIWQLRRMMNSQTRKPDLWFVVNYPQTLWPCDITQRYRYAYERFSDEFDLILFMENDDFYHPEYIETMLSEWKKHGKPDIFGTNYTIYYHVRLRKWFTFHHTRRSSMMSTLIRTKLSIQWPVDGEPYTDAHLWKQLNGVTFEPEKHICLGIKHGLTPSGGAFHNDRLDRYVNDDENGEFLKSVTGDNFDFYADFQG
jgi:glycosyltransferase involved in cell wall biosynthesis